MPLEEAPRLPFGSPKLLVKKLLWQVRALWPEVMAAAAADKEEREPGLGNPSQALHSWDALSERGVKRKTYTPLTEVGVMLLMDWRASLLWHRNPL